ncbi:MAG: HD domain-containing protein [Candidatus Bipolaricaulota bacterium]|nr:HD domain-containing protein [Candidatus Bipolaricaulota bacterium]
MPDDRLDGLTKLFFELGQLKRSPRSGWLRLGIEEPETVAEHSFRTAAIGFFLAILEGADPYRSAAFCLFHDIGESRTGDLDWLAQRYSPGDDYISTEVLEDQIESLPEDLHNEISDLMKGTQEENGDLLLIARDADLMDLLIQSLEYLASGRDLAEKWFVNTVPLLKTESAKGIAENLKKKLEEDDLNEDVFWWV